MTKFDVDHVFPWIRGGRSVRDNFWASQRGCWCTLLDKDLPANHATMPSHRASTGLQIAT